LAKQLCEDVAENREVTQKAGAVTQIHASADQKTKYLQSLTMFKLYLIYKEKIMNMYFKKMNLLGCVALAICLACLPSIAISAVDSLTTDEIVQYGPQDAYWQFTASCSNGAKRVVRRKTDSDNWCALDLDNFCDTNRENAAQKTCSESFDEQYAQSESVRKAQQEAANAAARMRNDERLATERRAAEQRAREAAAQARVEREAQRVEDARNQLSVEAQLLKIEQEKLQLQRQELQLMRRAMEIEEELGAIN